MEVLNGLWGGVSRVSPLEFSGYTHIGIERNKGVYCSLGVTLDAPRDGKALLPEVGVRWGFSAKLDPESRLAVRVFTHAVLTVKFEAVRVVLKSFKIVYLAG